MPKWRYACPEGHQAIRMGFSTCQCQTCNRSYPREDITDLKTGKQLTPRGGPALQANRN